MAQLAGYIAEHTAYHHGEASLHSTIINMAQGYVGANNLPLLEESGQFGTRHAGGKDAASPRYIYTRLTPAARALFPEADDELLERVEDDGDLVEPMHYAPIIPLLLVNGTHGIGTGWSSQVPGHNPLDVIANVERMLNGEQPLAMRPWARGFVGDLEPATGNKGAFITQGCVHRTADSMVEIQELPLGRWTEDYKRTLVSASLTWSTLQTFTHHPTRRQIS